MTEYGQIKKIVGQSETSEYHAFVDSLVSLADAHFHNKGALHTGGDLFRKKTGRRYNEHVAINTGCLSL